jgi:predicted enzyme related to lactoylglutathione lyase
MTDRTSYAPGTPSWVDVSSPDTDASAAFYGGLFGWTATDPDEAGGGYRMLMIGDKFVAGLGPLQPDSGPPSWTTHVTVADADATAAAITAAGGTVIVPPMDVMDAGRMAIAFDVAGAAFAIWQPNMHIGAQLVNEENTFCWNELNLRGGTDASAAFYGAVFGWTSRSSDMGEGMTYTEFLVGEDSIAGMMELPPDVPAEVPPHWLTYFTVADCDAAAARVVELGGAVAAPPMTAGPGRFAVCADPFDAVFAVMQFTDGSM